MNRATIEIVRIADIGHVVRAVGILRDPDGVTCLDRQVALSVPKERGKALLSVTWNDGECQSTTLAPKHRRRVNRVLRAAIDKHMGWC